MLLALSDFENNYKYSYPHYNGLEKKITRLVRSPALFTKEVWNSAKYV